jgi:gliding motility-associated-like protein
MKKPSSLSALISKFLLLTSSIILFAGIFCQAQDPFTATPASGCAPLTVKFEDTSGSPSRSWNLGNGNPPNGLVDPQTTYTEDGDYIVTLTLASGVTQTRTIHVYALPTPNFTFNNPSGCAPLKVDFTDDSDPGSGVITEWLWAFGDGGSSTEQNPDDYEFLSPGDYAISLKVTNEFGCERTGSALNSTISVNGPIASFTADEKTVCQVPATIEFNNTSGNNLTYKWDFKDGSAIDTSPDLTVRHEFKQAGTYEVELKARDVSGCESSETMVINIGNEPGLEMTPSALQICSGETVTFTETGTSTILSRDWDFGNGVKVSGPPPEITYKATTTTKFNVTLTAQLQGKACTSKVTKVIEVVAMPTPNFTYKADCNYNVTFTSTSTNASRVEWYIANLLASTQKTFSRNLPSSTPYEIMLIAYNSLGCSDTLETNVSAASRPLAAFSPFQEQDCVAPSLAGCASPGAPFNLQLKNLSAPATGLTYLWRFGHASTPTSPSTSTEKDPLHEYAVKGRFELTLIVTNAAGCKDTVSSFVNVETQTPVAKFTISDTKVCARKDITFRDDSDNATFWCWDFGDESPPVSGKVVTHSYVVPGIYSVTLTAKNAGCFSVLTKTNVIEVMDPLILFTVAPRNCNDPLNVSLINESDRESDTRITWDFGDGSLTSDDPNLPDHRYAKSGNYTITLSGTDLGTGCTTEHKVPVPVEKLEAIFDLDNVKLCKGETVKFTDQSEYAVSWSWSFGSAGFSTEQHPLVRFNQPGDQDIVLEVTDAAGCKKQASFQLPVINILGDFSFTATSNCDELTVNFTDLSFGTPPIQSWSWDFGNDLPENTAKDPSGVVYDALGTYAIRLKLKNTDGDECNYVKQNAITFTKPIPFFSPSKPAACIDEVVTLNNTSAYATSFTWDFKDGRGSTDPHASIRYSATGPYTIKLTADDGIGCKQSIEIKDVITITKPVAAFSATNVKSDCPPLITTFTYDPDASGSNVTQWNWSFGDGKFSVVKSPVYTYLKPGNFDVSLRVTDSNGCSDTTVVEKLVQVGGPYGDFYNGIPGGTCVFQNVPFTAITTNAVKHVWDFGDGIVTDTEQGTEVSHTYTTSGFYTTSLVLIDANGCKFPAEGNGSVVIHDTTAVDFSYAPKCIFESEPFVLEASAEEDVAMSWEWIIENTTAGTEQQLAMALDSAAEFKVTLRAINEHGCPSSVSHVLPVYGNLTFIPNVFTPNADGYNASFVIPNAEKSQWDIKIFNRWGYPVYEKDNYLSDWDGDGADTGVYYYYVVNSFCKDRSYKGIISIMR